jgi:hypothetical protein
MSCLTNIASLVPESPRPPLLLHHHYQAGLEMVSLTVPVMWQHPISHRTKSPNLSRCLSSPMQQLLITIRPLVKSDSHLWPRTHAARAHLLKGLPWDLVIPHLSHSATPIIRSHKTASLMTHSKLLLLFVASFFFFFNKQVACYEEEKIVLRILAIFGWLSCT